MLSIEDFIKKLYSRKDSIGIVIACSGRKRSDYEIYSLGNVLSFTSAIGSQDSVMFDHIIESYRKCTKAYHSDAVKPSRKYPAFLRYNGAFYLSVWDRGGVKVWEKVITDKWKVLILSSYYGFLRITDPINDYNLYMKKVNVKCRAMLQGILKSIMETNNIEEVYFLTSKTYAEQFVNGSVNAYRVRLYDAHRIEIRGSMGRDYYREVGSLFASIIDGQLYGKTKYVYLEEI